MNKPDKQQIFSISNKEQFTAAALQVFNFQAGNCTVYKNFIAGLRIHPATINTIEAIPFLPIEFFKAHKVISSKADAEITFTSSGTTGITTSSHYVTDVSWYEDSFRKAFQLFYGD